MLLVFFISRDIGEGATSEDRAARQLPLGAMVPASSSDQVEWLVAAKDLLRHPLESSSHMTPAPVTRPALSAFKAHSCA
jgi:hypothetical protein